MLDGRNEGRAAGKDHLRNCVRIDATTAETVVDRGRQFVECRLDRLLELIARDLSIKSGEP